MYENLVEGILDDKEYQLAKVKYADEAKKLSAESEDIKNRKKYMDSAILFDTEWTRLVKSAKCETELTQNLVDTLIEAVYVYEDKRIEVKFKYAEERNEMVHLMETMMKGVA